MIPKWLILTGLGLIALALLLHGGIYQFTYVEGAIIRFNRFTGSTVICTGQKCWEIGHEAR